MILVHSPLVQRGILPLAAIHKNWMTEFGHSTDADVFAAEYDLVLANASDITVEQLNTLRILASQSGKIVLTASLDVIPADIKSLSLSSGKLVGIIGEESTRATETYLKLHKFKFNFNFAATQTSEMTFYQAMYQQLGILIFNEVGTSEQYSVTITAMDTLDKLSGLMTVVQTDYEFSTPAQDWSTWYTTQVTPSELLTNNPQMAADFVTCWNTINTAGVNAQFQSYQSVLGQDNAAKFESVIDYLRTATA